MHFAGACRVPRSACGGAPRQPCSPVDGLESGKPACRAGRPTLAILPFFVRSLPFRNEQSFTNFARAPPSTRVVPAPYAAMDPDQSRGWCEECGTNSMKSALAQ
jgi:hypothetical protein